MMLTGALVGAALPVGCTNEPQVVASGNNVTLSHKLIDFGRARTIAVDYCSDRDMDVRLIGKKTEMWVVSFFECVPKK